MVTLTSNEPKGVDTFIELGDSPSSYSGEAGKSIAVNGSEDGLTFVNNVATDEKVSITSLDTTPSYLNNKIVVGSTKLTKTVNNPTGNEELSLDIDESKIDHGSIGGLGDDDHTQYLLVSGSRAMSGNLQMGDNNISGVNNITFTDVNGQIAGIENQNLLDKTADETITGDWIYNGEQYSYSATIDTTSNHHYLQVSPVWQPTAGNNTGTLNTLKATFSTGGSYNFTNVQACQIVGIHNIDQRITNMYGVRCQIVIGGIFSDGLGYVTTAIGGEFQAFNRSDSATASDIIEGGRFISDIRAANDVNTVVGGRFQLKKSGSSTVTTYRGLYIDTTYITAGTITDFRGIEIGDLGGCTITNNPIVINIQNQTESGAIGIDFGTIGVTLHSTDVDAYMYHRGNIIIEWDYRGVIFGAGQDASIFYNGSDLVISPQLVGNGGLRVLNMKSGANQAGAGAAADELWVTSSHATLPDNVVMRGV